MPVSRMQVEIELKRIVGSEIFGGREGLLEQPKAVRLLTFLVTGTFEGKLLKETELLIDFYGIPVDSLDAAQDVARIDVLRLRAKLKKYFDSEGVDDPVIITIPKGQYRAQCSLNPDSSAQRQVKLGFDHVNEETPSHIRQALIHFENAIGLESSLADAWAGKASAYLTMTLHAYSVDPSTLFVDAEEAAMKAVTLDKSCWRGHANLGAIYLFRHEWLRADEAFATAKRLAPLDLSEIGGYGPYLLSRGHHGEARKLAVDYSEIGFDDVVLLTRAGLIQYVLRDYDDAIANLTRASERDVNFWRSHLILAFAYLSLKEPVKALAEMDEVRYCARANLWPGMRILCLEMAGQSDEAEAEFGALLELAKSSYVQPMQLGLARMALGDSEGAVANFSEACDASDPFTAWLHLWPFLDSLRGSRAFRDLLRKWKFVSL